jgi:hypothetical protein
MIFVLCEGPTEALFVSSILRPHWIEPQGKWCQPITLGGLRPFGRVLAQIRLLLRNPTCRVTTLIDYYGMPEDYSGMPHRPTPPGNRGAVVTEVTRLEKALGDIVDSPRFIPHYSLHEFESLAFADPAAIAAQRARLPGGAILAQVNAMLAEAANNPEWVNDSPITSPSHRLEGLWPDNQYQKTVDSVGIVQRIPFDHLRARCPHFSAWVAAL